MNRPNLTQLSKEIEEAIKKFGNSEFNILKWLEEQGIPVLHLNLKGNWYDMIEQGIKKEEYREIKLSYNRIFGDNGIKIKKRYYHPTDVVVCFSNGYATDRRQMLWTLKDKRVYFGKEEWGAVKDVTYYVLYVNEKVYSNSTL